MRVPKDGEKKKSPRMMAHLWKHHEEAREYPLDLDGKPRARIEERGASVLRRGPKFGRARENAANHENHQEKILKRMESS